MGRTIAILIGLCSLVACETGNQTHLVEGREVTGADPGSSRCPTTACESTEVCLQGVCQCANGYHWLDGACVDVDECATGTHDCHPLAQCTNVPGHVQCTCSPGYVGDGRLCTDVDECADGTADCGANTVCTNLDGGALCQCAVGFVLDGDACVDEDECAEGTHRCDPNAQCNNTDGGHECVCLAGFFGDGTRCIDVDECADDAHDCDAHGECTNTLGGFECRCAAGYVGDGRACDDIDECAAATDNCSDFARCSNVDGGFQCECGPGYIGDGVRCENVDECAGPMFACPENATCRDTPGSVQCDCLAGFVPRDGLCVDLDECAEGLDHCDADAECANTEGDYRCICPPGLMALDGRCVDLDECADGTAQCHPEARCINVRGGYDCTCGTGYTGDGRTCADVDECAQDTDDCHENADCENEPGGFTCLCDEGFSGNGRQCEDVDECEQGIAFCHRNAVCINTPGSWDCPCRAGFAGDGVFTCDDVDECATGTDGCTPVALCINAVGTYDCECPDGYRGDGFDCEDVDECLENTHDCVVDPLCVNTVGAFECAPSVFFVCDCAPDDPDCVPGNDAAEGRSPETPWQSLTPLTDPAFLARLEPGISIRFCRRGRFEGDLSIPEGIRCTAEEPCALGAYGADIEERKPTFSGALVIAEDQEGLVVDGLALVGMAVGAGVDVAPGAREITLRNLTVTGWAMGVAAPQAEGLILADSIITDNIRAGWLGGGNRLVLEGNLFARNAGADFTHHNVHLACADGCTELTVRDNEITDSSLNRDGACFLPALGLFGRASQVLLDGNFIHQGLGAAEQSCDGIAVGPETRGVEEGFDDVIVRGNRIINMGGTGIGVSACVGCVVENNVVIQEQALTFKGIVAPDRRIQGEDTELDAFVVRNNSIWIGRQIETVAIAIQVYRQGDEHQIINNAIVNLSQGFNSCCIDQDRDLNRYADIDYNICLLADDNPAGSWALGYGPLVRWQDTGFGTHSEEADPSYRAPMGPDFDLRAAGPDAPIVDHGSPGSSATDLTGAARDAAPDVGAYEYVP